MKKNKKAIPRKECIYIIKCINYHSHSEFHFTFTIYDMILNCSFMHWFWARYTVIEYQWNFQLDITTGSSSNDSNENNNNQRIPIIWIFGFQFYVNRRI